MPLYDLTCDRCGDTIEMMVPYESLRDAREHDCGGTLHYTPGFKPRVSRPSFGLVMNNGQRVPGMLGKEAPRRRKKR